MESQWHAVDLEDFDYLRSTETPKSLLIHCLVYPGRAERRRLQKLPRIVSEGSGSIPVQSQGSIVHPAFDRNLACLLLFNQNGVKQKKKKSMPRFEEISNSAFLGEKMIN